MAKRKADADLISRILSLHDQTVRMLAIAILAMFYCVIGNLGFLERDKAMLVFRDNVCFSISIIFPKCFLSVSAQSVVTNERVFTRHPSCILGLCLNDQSKLGPDCLSFVPEA